MLGRVMRRSGKELVPEPKVASAEDDDNEFGRCKVCRRNCYRGSTSDICQACLRCNVDYQYQNRTFPLHPPASEANATEPPASGREKAFPRLFRSLLKRAVRAKTIAVSLLGSLAIAIRSSHVADHYATKYLAKSQQWLSSALGPLITGLRRAEERAIDEERQLTMREQALRNIRVAIFAANRCVWVSPCEASLYLRCGSLAVLSHYSTVVHGRRGFMMMHECKRRLNNEIAGAGLWEPLLGTESHGSTCMEVHLGELQ